MTRPGLAIRSYVFGCFNTGDRRRYSWHRHACDPHQDLDRLHVQDACRSPLHVVVLTGKKFQRHSIDSVNDNVMTLIRCATQPRARYLVIGTRYKEYERRKQKDNATASSPRFAANGRTSSVPELAVKAAGDGSFLARSMYSNIRFSRDSRRATAAASYFRDGDQKIAVWSSSTRATSAGRGGRPARVSRR